MRKGIPCAATKPDGSPCGNKVKREGDYCRFHSERGSDYASRLAARKHTKPPKVEPVSMRTSEEILGVIESTVASIQAGRLVSQSGFAIARLAKVALLCLGAVMPGKQTSSKEEDEPATPRRSGWEPPDLGVVGGGEGGAS